MESKLEIVEDTGKSFRIAYDDVVIIDHNVKDPDDVMHIPLIPLR